MTGIAVLGIALVVNDVISALTLAYNLLVGGMLVPLDRRDLLEARDNLGRNHVHEPGLCDRAGIHVQGWVGCKHADLLQPGVALVSFVLVSLLSRRPEKVAAAVV